jgi:8-oxo-dGTP pyrophosphatase MutT (NUDIX family)
MSMSRLALMAKVTVQAMLAPVAFAACALVVRDSKILLVRHSYVRGWLLPGGGVGRAEPPSEAIIRELKEEIGLVRSSPPEFVGLYSRRTGWVTNVIALYRIDDAEFNFRSNLEVREVQFVDPIAPPDGTPPSVRRRLLEFARLQPQSARW